MTEVVIPLIIRDLTPDDLPSCAWSGPAVHLAGIARMLERAQRGEVDYRALYERLGYVAYGRAPESWDEQAPDGTIVRYETICTLMRKELS